MVSLDISAYMLPKAGTPRHRCEDAYAFELKTGHVAVADGASDAFESGIWARLLVASYVNAPPKPEMKAFLEWIQRCTKMWYLTLSWEDLPWYAQQKILGVGGLATLLGFNLERTSTSATAHWQALAIGDTCLIHLRGRSILERFPVEHPEAFGNTPALLTTNVEVVQKILEGEHLLHRSGACEVGDIFLLATDAMAEWLYRFIEHDEFKLGWDIIWELIEDDFEAFIEDLRIQSKIRNDDVTLLVLRIVEDQD